jgi:hypothetical protein
MSRIRPVIAITIITQSTLRTSSDSCQSVSLAVLFGNNGNSYTISKQSDMCMYTHVLHNIQTLVGQGNERKLGQERTPRAIGSQAVIYYLLLCLSYSVSPALFVAKVAIKYRSNSTFLTRLCPIFLQHTSYRTPLLFHKYSPEVKTFISGVLAIDLCITTTNSFRLFHSSFSYTIHLFFVK